MRIRTIFLVLLACGLVGCATDGFKKGSGDVGPFILQQAIARGGTPATNSLPAVTGSWSYSEDQAGVVIRMARDQYPAIEAFLREAFGTPTVGPSATRDGGLLGVYRLSPKGGGIQFGYDARQTQVIILRPLTKEEILRGMGNATKETEKSR